MLLGKKTKIMKKILIATMILITPIAWAQDIVGTVNTVTVNASITKSYQPDYYKIKVTLQEYDDVNPNNQQTKTIQIGEIENNFREKIKVLKVSDVILYNVSESNQTSNYNLSRNYNSTKKKKLSKVLTFKLNNLAQVEQMFKSMRINGIVQVQVVPQFNPETKIKNESDLLKQAMIMAAAKAKKMEILLGVKLGPVIAVYETNPGVDTTLDYNYNYSSNTISKQLNKVVSSTNLEVSYLIKSTN